MPRIVPGTVELGYNVNKTDTDSVLKGFEKDLKFISSRYL